MSETYLTTVEMVTLTGHQLIYDRGLNYDWFPRGAARAPEWLVNI